MSLPHVNGLAMPGMWIDPSLLSTNTSSSGRRFQAESADGDDVAFHCLRIPRFHQERANRQAAAPHLHSVDLSMGVAGRARFLLGLPQYPVVSIRLMRVAQDVILRSQTFSWIDRHKLRFVRTVLLRTSKQN